MSFKTECKMTLEGHPRSLISAPTESAYVASYWTSIVTLVLFCRVSEILELLYTERHFFQILEAITAKRLKIDSHCQQQNCRSPNVLFRNVQITLMLLGVPPLGGLQSQSSGENGDFQALYAKMSRKR